MALALHTFDLGINYLINEDEFHIDGQGIWYGMVTGTVVQTLALFYIVYRTNWQKEVCMSKLDWIDGIKVDVVCDCDINRLRWQLRGSRCGVANHMLILHTTLSTRII